MIPNLIEKVTSNDLTILIFDNGTLSTGFEIDLVDLEIINETNLQDELLNFVRYISPDISVKIIQNTRQSN